MTSYSHEFVIQIYFVKSFVTNFTLNLLLYLMRTLESLLKPGFCESSQIFTLSLKQRTLFLGIFRPQSLNFNQTLNSNKLILTRPSVFLVNHWYLKVLKLEFQSNTEFQWANPNMTLNFYSLSLIPKGTPSNISGDKKGVLKFCKNSKIEVNLLNNNLDMAATSHGN